MKKYTRMSLAVLLGMGVMFPAWAEVAVIVHKDNNVDLDEAQIRNIYLGKVKTFNGGLTASPIDLKPGDKAREEFVSKVLRKSEANLNSYWARMLFSSKGRPPVEMKDSSAVVDAVAASKSAIGYVDAGAVNSSVRVLMEIK